MDINNLDYTKLTKTYNPHVLAKLNNEQKNILDNMPVEDKVLLSRYLYTQGLDTIYNDRIYDEIIDTPYLSKYKTIQYEQDPITQKLMTNLKLLGLLVPANSNFNDSYNKENNNFNNRLKLRDKFNTNRSMMCVTTGEDFVNKYLNEYLKMTKVFLLSYKHDGWNISIYYIPGQETVYLAHTRGREGAEVKDVTKMMSKIMPKLKVDFPIKISGEIVLKRSYMEKLKEKYPERSWVNVRNSVATFVAGNINEEDYEALDFFAFNMESLEPVTNKNDIINIEYNNDKITKTNQIKNTIDVYKFLENNGFKTPDWRVVKPNIKDIQESIKDLMSNYINKVEKEYECDGLVMLSIPKNNNTIHTGTFSSYSSGMVAIKAWYWASEIMVSKIEEIYYSDNKRQYTPKARVTPVKSRSGSMVSTVPFDNLRQVIQDWLCPGDMIEFEYHSQQNVMYRNKISGAIKPEIKLE